MCLTARQHSSCKRAATTGQAPDLFAALLLELDCVRKKGAQPLGASDRATVPEKVSERAMLRCTLVQYHTLKPLIGKSMQESRSNLRLACGKHIARILSVAIITCFSLIALSLHVKHGDLPSYTSILVNARCCFRVVN